MKYNEAIQTSLNFGHFSEFSFNCTGNALTTQHTNLIIVTLMDGDLMINVE